MLNQNTLLEVTCHEAQKWFASDSPPLLVDCRERHEHELVALTGSLLLPMSELAARVEELASYREKPIVIYCHHGMRSMQVAMWLRAQGFPLSQSLAGGIDRWATEIEPGMVRY